jgi:exopolysaccharide biosynthesis protein
VGRAGLWRANLLAALLVCASLLSAQASWLGTPEAIARGIDLFRSTDTTLVDRAGPIALYLLRLDPARVSLASGLSNGKVMESERVEGIAARHQAVAAVNGGFFNVKNGEPTGLLKVAGELVSDSGITRGLVAIKGSATSRPELEFDQASVRMLLKVKNAGTDQTIAIDGVDTTRERGKLMIYTPSYHADTDTAANGIEWVLSGRPLQVTLIRRDAGRTPIPRDGAVLSYGGLDPPSPLSMVAIGTRVTLEIAWKPLHALSPRFLDQAQHVVNGAGLLKRNGLAITNWRWAENLNPQTFIDMRHPRTMIGVDHRGQIWLVAVDGRQPDYSIGMTLPDLVRLADRLGLRDALNLDGGGSTTMVVKGKVVNRPSDPTGPRAVSDAIIVRSR